MKTIKGIIQTFAIVLLCVTVSLVRGQNVLQFTAIRATDEGAIHLEWASQSNHVYQIRSADELIDTNTGTTDWEVLYDNYPSQGTNTFWLDTGNYFTASPPIVHPSQSPMRFYQVVDKGPDDLVGDEPSVMIFSPTNGTAASGLLTVSVMASSDQGSVYHKLYVDGQEMWPSEDGTNYVINTCEWDNGPHTLFATATESTMPDTTSNIGLTGHAVSPFLTVYFSNLVTRISFSQQFFEPSLGETQQVSAVFAVNSGWTLQIEDFSSNVVRTVTGNGTTLSFAWDGTDSNGVEVVNGNYYYYISAETNNPPGGLTMQTTARSSIFGDGVEELWVMPSDGVYIPLKIYPPGINTNGWDIVEASPSQIAALSPTDAEPMDAGSGFAAAGFAGPSAQAAPPAPLRPPNPPCKGTVGTIGIAWQMYNANGTNPVNASPLSDGSGITGEDIQMAGNPGNSSLPYAPFRQVDNVALNFVNEMRKGCYDLGYVENNDNLTLSSLQGSGNPFNNVDIGLLIIHGNYGTSTDYTTGHPFKGIYFPIASGGSAKYLRMSDMSLGGSSPTNGLKWLALMACTGLYQQNWNSMKSQNVMPYNGNMHMILGAGTDLADEPLVGQYWADFMLGDPNQQPSPRPPEKIRDAWYDAGTKAYAAGVTNGVGTSYPNPTTYAVAADSNCSEDFLKTNSLPSGSGVWGYYNSKTVFSR